MDAPIDPDAMLIPYPPCPFILYYLKILDMRTFSSILA